MARTSVCYRGFPGGSDGKESSCNAGDLDSFPGLEKSPREGKGYPLQYSGEFHGQCSPWDLKELDTTEQLSLTHSLRLSNADYPPNGAKPHPIS